MAKFLCTMIFNQGRYGWTESWYRDSSDYFTALQALTNLATRRTSLLGSGARIEVAKVSDVEAVGDSKDSTIGLDGMIQQLGADTPWNAIYARINAGGLYRRQMWLRGIPDAWIALTAGNPNVNPLDGILSSAFNTFKNYLVSQAWLLRVILKTGAGATETTVTAFSINGDGKMVFNVAGVPGGPGDTFRIKYAVGPNPKLVNGVYTIQSNLAGVITTTTTAPDGLVPGDYNGMKHRPRIISYESITDGVIKRCGKRSTGRAFFVQAGRRPVRG